MIRASTGVPPFFIDKMPNNFRHLGLIHLILPQARIIDARREPMACCFSNFKQLFAEGQEFTYSLEDIGRYYRDLCRADASLGGRCCPATCCASSTRTWSRTSKGSVRRLLEFLAWVRAGMPGVCNRRAQCAHCKLGASSAAYLQRGPGPVAPFRTLAGAIEQDALARAH